MVPSHDLPPASSGGMTNGIHLYALVSGFIAPGINRACLHKGFTTTGVIGGLAPAGISRRIAFPVGFRFGPGIEAPYLDRHRQGPLGQMRF
jgi:hypothetical protein